MSADRYVGVVEASDWCTRHAISSKTSNALYHLLCALVRSEHKRFQCCLNVNNNDNISGHISAL